MQGNIVVIMIYHTLMLTPPAWFLASIFIVICYMEIELMYKSIEDTTISNHSAKIDNTDIMIIDMLKEGKAYKEISYDIKMPVNTLKKRISNIYKAYSVPNRNALIMKLLRQNSKK